MKERLPGRRGQHRDKTKTWRQIDAEIVKISAQGVMDIDFSERLHSFEHFEKMGLNRTFW